MKLKVPLEWYEILVKVSEDRRIKLSQLLRSLETDECLGLPYVEPAGRFKVINVPAPLQLSAVRRFLFCD